MYTANEMLKQFGELKTLPHVVIRLTTLISNENTHIQELEKLINMDPVLVFRLLRLVNSSFYGLQQKVDNVSIAVAYIGLKNLRNLLLASSLKPAFDKGTQNGAFSGTRLWLHSAAVAICSKMISERIFGTIGEDVFLCGLLHDIGLIIENQVANSLFSHTCKSYLPETKPFIEYERDIIGLDHCQLGSLLALEMGLPEQLQQGIRFHHSLQDDISPSSLPGIIQIADYLVSKLGYKALLGIDSVLSTHLTNYLIDNMDEYKALARDLPNEMLSARELYEPERS